MLAVIADADFTQVFRPRAGIRAGLEDWSTRFLRIYLHEGYRASWEKIVLRGQSPQETPARDPQEELQDSTESTCILTLDFPASRTFPMLFISSWRFGFSSSMKKFPLTCLITEVCRWQSLLLSFLIMFLFHLHSWRIIHWIINDTVTRYIGLEGYFYWT